MYHMHWTLDEVRALTMPQFNWIVKSLERQKKKEAEALRVRRR